MSSRQTATVFYLAKLPFLSVCNWRNKNEVWFFESFWRKEDATEVKSVNISWVCLLGALLRSSLPKIFFVIIYIIVYTRRLVKCHLKLSIACACVDQRHVDIQLRSSVSWVKKPYRHNQITSPSASLTVLQLFRLPTNSNSSSSQLTQTRLSIMSFADGEWLSLHVW